MGTIRHIAIVLGTRPEAIKLAPVIAALQSQPQAFQVSVISTGQHDEMLSSLLSVFNIRPDVDLGIMKPRQTLCYLASEILRLLPEILEQREVDMLLVQGDTTSSFVAGLCASYLKIPVAHVEAGLRSYNMLHPFPEEMNRRLSSHLSEIHFAPTERNKQALLKESIQKNKIHVTGNTVIDALFQIRDKNLPFQNKTLDALTASKRRFILLTAHRRENLGKPLESICKSIRTLVSEYQGELGVIFPVHLNPKVSEVVHRHLGGIDQVHLLPPLDYCDFVRLLDRCYFVLSDSGGLQEEAPALGKPVLVMREVTERPEAVETGAALLVGSTSENILPACRRLLNDPEHYQQMAVGQSPYGDGQASQRICEILLHRFGFRDNLPEPYSYP